jgi:hypothetical protein
MDKSLQSVIDMLKSLRSKSTHIISDFDLNNFNIFITFCGLLSIPQYVLKNKNCEPEDDLNQSKCVLLCNEWKVVVFGRILFLIAIMNTRTE